jgi:hypothetical protein
VFENFGDVQVTKFVFTLLADEDVGWLYIAMDYLLVVEGFEAF